jgi:hypothetical protein
VTHLSRNTQANCFPQNTGALRDNVGQCVVRSSDVAATGKFAIKPSHRLDRSTALNDFL